ncbi:MAG TPA: rRNA maturation RNase YbeY [Rhizomicrobium sp.]|nr:rRNA maturation RNase YbeY [Rhizomicrobium sp.]
MTAKGILVVVDDPGWRRFRGLVPGLTRAAAAAARAAGFRGDYSLTVLLSSDRKLKSLNRDFRGLDKATNVLSFPATANRDKYRGDVALALGVTRREAKASAKRVADHATHLVVHGVLHLAGYDHVRVRDAKKMEALEIKILDRLGIANPYEAAG